jgi:hypothetical protein
VLLLIVNIPFRMVITIKNNKENYNFNNYILHKKQREMR